MKTQNRENGVTVSLNNTEDEMGNSRTENKKAKKRTRRLTWENKDKPLLTQAEFLEILRKASRPAQPVIVQPDPETIET